MTVFLLAAGLLNTTSASDSYDPLQVDKAGEIRPLDRTVIDPGRDREIPVRIYLPQSKGPVPCVLFSHGLGGTRETCGYLGEHWSRRGYVTVAIQHHGSDDAVWRAVRPGQRFAAMDRAASVGNFILRVQDVSVVLDQLEKWNSQQGHPLQARMDLRRIGMSGHSFGAQTTQAVAGMSIPLLGERSRDERIRAAIILSPGSPRGRDPAQAFQAVRIPWLLMTGTEDTSPIGGQTVASRLAVFDALPSGQKYQLVLDKAEHSAFTERALPGDRQPRNPNHHRVIRAVTTAFWDAWLREDAAARDWLDGSGPDRILQNHDRWQTK